MQENALHMISFPDPVDDWDVSGAWVISDLDAWLSDDDDATMKASCGDALGNGEQIILLGEEQTRTIHLHDGTTRDCSYVLALTRVGIGWVGKQLCVPVGQ